MGFLRRVSGWLVDRLGLRQVSSVVADHPVPPGAAKGKTAWMYIFGTSILVAFLLQLLTGIALASKYVAAPAHAYDSIRFLTTEVSFGRLLRGMHYFGAAAMVVLVMLHAARVFLTGSYKFPREMTWLTGVALLVLTLTMAFTGQLLRWDQNGVWGVFVASQYVGRVPLIGPALKELVLAGETVGGSTLTRFFALHVVLVPLLILGIVGVHLYLVIRHGISEPPEAGRAVDRETYRERHRTLTRREGKPYFPYVAWHEVAAGVFVVLLIVVLAYVSGPRELAGPPDPTDVPAEPKPDWFLVWYYALLALKPGSLETFTMVYLPLIALALLVLLPLVAPLGERSPGRRPWAVAAVVTVGVLLAGLTRLGVQAHWVMDFESEPLTPAELGTTDPAVIEGAVLFWANGCQACHGAAGRGAKYGPAIEDIVQRLSPEVINDRVIKGYRDMPSYRGRITAEELAAIARFGRALGAR